MNLSDGICRRVARGLWAWAAVLAVAGCGGGGGDGGSVTPSGVSNAPPPANTVRIHYQRADAAYAGWGVYSWEGPAVLYTEWPSVDRYRFDKSDSFGASIDIATDPAKSQMQFLVNKASGASDAIKSPDCDLIFDFNATIGSKGQEVWVKDRSCTVFGSAREANGIDIGSAKAMWLAKGTIAWPGGSTSQNYKLYHAAEGGIVVDPDAGVGGADGSFDLVARAGIGGLAARFPHLATALGLGVPASAQGQAATLLKGQLVVVEFGADGKPVTATQLQNQGVIDDLYASAAAPQTLGVSFGTDGRPTFRLWAPTARSVTLNVGANSVAMTADAASGVWRVVGQAAWVNAATYTYTVSVCSRTDGGAVRSYTVTDPYAVTLNADVYNAASQQAMVANLASAAMKPPGWDGAARPAAIEPEDIVLYELHIRDFSANDASVPAALRGKYRAFAQAGTSGTRHLQSLAAAGLTHVHLLPSYDFSSVSESGCRTPVISNTDPVSRSPQSKAAAAKDSDCFNWGYDPKHFGAPDGSYASSAADGAVRVREFREMVLGLHRSGLQVVMDVVYNHTAGNFFDRIVPGYYYRLNGDGNIENSTCCQNTATEFAMMAKLMSDTLVRWAVDYRVDGFRFDIMGHIPKAVMLQAKARVDAAVGASRKVYFYGEAWNFGEVENDRLFVQARQANLAGTGIGSFSDRMRDAIRGGGPFDAGDGMIINQGFASGLCYDVNLLAGSCTQATRDALYARQDWIRLGMAGNLADFRLHGVLGRDIDYAGQGAGYTRDPQEIINYAGVHDGETLYDISQYKHPEDTTSAERSRAQVVALGTVLMAQGVPFIHAGDELLRSKAFDRDSYNAGDWFNRIDWTGTTNYLNTFGLPSAEKNASNWALMTPFLLNASVTPSTRDITSARDAVLDLIRLRKSSTMFRLRTGADVKRCVTFPDENSQRDGVIVMRIGQDGQLCGDGAFKTLLVVINANDQRQTFNVSALANRSFALHPVQAGGFDAVVRSAAYTRSSGAFSVPARTVAVFAEP